MMDVRKESKVVRRSRYLTYFGLTVAGGAAAYAAYKYIYDVDEKKDVSKSQRSSSWWSEVYSWWTQSSSGRTTLVQDDGSSSENKQNGIDSDRLTIEQQDMNAHVEQHFQTIQSIASKTTIVSLMVPLSENIRDWDGMDDIVDRLKSAVGQGDGKMSVEEKLALWRIVLRHVFGRYVAVVWLVPMLHVHVRVLLHVLGRTLYIQSLDPQVPLLSSSAQEAFLSLGEYMGNHGYSYVMELASKAAESALAGISGVTDIVTAADVNTILSSALSNFEEQIISNNSVSDAWHASMLPERDDYMTEKLPDLKSQADIDCLRLMFDETAHIIFSDELHNEYVKPCVMTLAEMISDAVSERIPTTGMPLVRVIPWMGNEIARVMDPPSNETDKDEDASPYFVYLTSQEERVHELSARVFSSGWIMKKNQ